MAIVSISLNDTILKEIDRIQNTLGYSGRSEVIRAGARLLISESKEKERLIGKINSTLLLIHSQDMEDVVTEIKHRLKEMVRLFQTSRKMDYVKLIVA
jgi:CopG family nickel-responsive transcriptional regulator